MASALLQPLGPTFANANADGSRPATRIASARSPRAAESSAGRAEFPPARTAALRPEFRVCRGECSSPWFLQIDDINSTSHGCGELVAVSDADQQLGRGQMACMAS